MSKKNKQKKSELKEVRGGFNHTVIRLRVGWSKKKIKTPKHDVPATLFRIHSTRFLLAPSTTRWRHSFPPTWREIDAQKKSLKKKKQSVEETPENRRDSRCYPVSLPVCPRGWGSTDGSSGRNLTHERVQQNNIHRLDMSARLIMTLQMEWVRVSQFISCLLPPFRTARCRA